MRIFATVGTQLHFDRLILALDQLGQDLKRNLFAQVGPSKLQINSFEYKDFLNPIEYNQRLKDCDLVISHAGMGTIISSLNYGKPIILFPRDSRLGEHRNQHQFSTCDRFSSLDGCSVAYTAEDLKFLIKNHRNCQSQSLSQSNQKLSENLFREIMDLFDKI